MTKLRLSTQLSCAESKPECSRASKQLFRFTSRMSCPPMVGETIILCIAMGRSVSTRGLFWPLTRGPQAMCQDCETRLHKSRNITTACEDRELYILTKLTSLNVPIISTQVKYQFLTMQSQAAFLVLVVPLLLTFVTARPYDELIACTHCPTNKDGDQIVNCMPISWARFQMFCSCQTGDIIQPAGQQCRPSKYLCL